MNITDNHGNTPLHLACSNGHEEVRGEEGRKGKEGKGRRGGGEGREEKVETVQRSKVCQSFRWNRKQNAWGEESELEREEGRGGIRIQGLCS